MCDRTKSFSRMSFLAFALLSAAVPAPAQEYRVIVNAANPGSQIKRDALAMIYLKGHARWADGKPVAAVDQSARSSVRATFTEQALGQDVRAVQNQWIRSIQVGQGTPPLVKSSDEDVVAFVKSNPNAIGYVSSNAPLDVAVKAVKVIE